MRAAVWADHSAIPRRGEELRRAFRYRVRAAAQATPGGVQRPHSVPARSVGRPQHAHRVGRTQLSTLPAPRGGCSEATRELPGRMRPGCRAPCRSKVGIMCTTFTLDQDARRVPAGPVYHCQQCTHSPLRTRGFPDEPLVLSIYSESGWAICLDRGHSVLRVPVIPETLQAIVLGIVQGLAEPLPISSSGHLIIVPWLLGWSDPGLIFDVALHIGTGLALLAYFWQDWLVLIRAFVGGITSTAGRQTPEWRLLWLILLASIPGALMGVLFEEPISQLLRNPVQVAVLLMLFGLVLWFVDRRATQRRTLQGLTWTDGLVVGLSQAAALIPGVSRSGATITAGLALGLTREAAARYSFLLGTPITLGAGLYGMRTFVRTGIPDNERAFFLAGMLASAVVGWLAVRFLLQWFLRHGTLTPFVIYRLLAGATVLLVAWLRPG